MPALNKVILLGNLTRDPESRTTPQGTVVCSFALAVNHRYATASGEAREEVCFVDIEVWGRQAQSCSTYLRKGAPALVDGRLRLDQWDDRETGKRRSRLRVQAERVQFVGPPLGGDFAGATAAAAAGAGSGHGQAMAAAPEDGPVEAEAPRAERGQAPMPAFEPLPADAGSVPDDIPF
jgi:single-strand DNA-binding protein